MKRASSSLLPFVLCRSSSVVVAAAAWGGVTPLPTRQSSASQWFHADAGVLQNTRTHPISYSLSSSISSRLLLGRDQLRRRSNNQSSQRLHQQQRQCVHSRTTRLSSASQDTSSDPTHETTDPAKEDDLVEQLRLAYSEGETDGVVDFLTQESSSGTSPFMLGDASVVSASDW
eukprot:scaffold30745_cov62-Attheya_sp.AAC.1